MTEYEYNKLKAAYEETMSRTGEEEEFGRRNMFFMEAMNL